MADFLFRFEAHFGCNPTLAALFHVENQAR
jgi:hypothetical protein